ncbi:MAG: ribonuclease H-like domain-containing protein [Candidatus Woesearchaeota archaeon]
MIKNTFIFLPKFGYEKEKKLWELGIKTWDDFLATKKILGISDFNKKRYDEIIKNAKKALLDNNSSYFLDKLKHRDNWRLYDFFKEDSVFLDIEVSRINGFLTMIGLFDGIDTKIMVKDLNLNLDALKKELSKYKLIITFNGSVFDIPFLNKKYPNLLPSIPNIDVKHLCNLIGLKGTLKEIEKKLEIKRQNEIVNKLYGGDPFRLWKIFKATGDKYYLDLLVEYNEEDIINLKKICEYCINELKNEINNIFKLF